MYGGSFKPEKTFMTVKLVHIVSAIVLSGCASTIPETPLVRKLDAEIQSTIGNTSEDRTTLLERAINEAQKFLAEQFVNDINGA
jgi:hypothetical protein